MIESRQNWYSLLHLGVMKLERLDESGAEAAWLASIEMAPSAWAFRNLAILALRCKDLDQARAYYEKAWECAVQSGRPHAALAIEYMEKLAENGQWAAGMAVYQALTPEMQRFDRAQILRGRFAMALGDLASVEEVLRREYAVIREGETTLTDLWFELHARRTGCSLEEARTLYPPPPGIDFRSFNG
jgi:tetratricopeptide (TPR) repeat protein